MTTTPQPRSGIADLPPYVAGRPADPGAFKLSSNENPFPPPAAILEAVAAAAASLNRYPDMACARLYAALGERLGVPTDWLAAGTGSVAVLYHLLQAFCGLGDEVVHAWRSFEAYPIAVSVCGATVIRVPVDEDGRHDLTAMRGAISPRTRVVILCTPNNPTGPALTHEEVADFVDHLRSDVLVVVDEAYREFVRFGDPVDGVELVRAYPNVVAMRTFAKAFGLAGLRVGYCVARPEIAAPIRACALPFGVSTIAQEAAVAALGCTSELAERVDAIVAERVRVLAALREQGWTVPDPQGNFVWLALGDRAADFAAMAGDAGIVVRPFAGDGVRVSIGEMPANDRFLDVARSYWSADPPRVLR
jgi:histidinol-phosphate aminotransferase